jgi:hypothetical protein
MGSSASRVTALANPGLPSAGQIPMRQVLVLAGGPSYERNMSPHSGRRVSDALTRAGTKVQLRNVDSRCDQSSRPKAIRPILHGADDEDGPSGMFWGHLKTPWAARDRLPAGSPGTGASPRHW